MPIQRKSVVSKTGLLQQMSEEIGALQALVIDLTRELTMMRLGMERLAARVYELERGASDKPDATLTVTVPSDIQCLKVPGGVILYGKKIPLNKDTADVLYHLVCQNDSVSKERLATLCTPQNQLNKGERILPGSLYQRLRRLKTALNAYHANLGECLVSVKKSTKGTPNDYSFDAERFRAILGIK